MYFIKAINEVNTEINRVYNTNILDACFRRAHQVYVDYYAKRITLAEAAESVYGVLFDNKLIKG